MFVDNDLEEEGSFIGESASTNQQQNVATFTMFSQKPEPSHSGGMLL